MNLIRAERVFCDLDVTVTDGDGNPVTPAAVAVALLAPRRTPDADTTWTAVALSGGTVTVLFAGPEADLTGALAVPAGGADLWVRATDEPEVVATRVERITVQ